MQANQRPSLIPYHLRTFLGGTSDYEDKGIAGAFKSGYGLDIRKSIDSLSCQQGLKDDLLPGFITAQPYFLVPSSDGNLYAFTYDGKIFRRKSNGDWNIQGAPNPVYTDTHESGHINGAAEWYDQDGNTYLFWSTPTRLNLKRIAGTGYTPSEPWTDVNTAPTPISTIDGISSYWPFVSSDLINDTVSNKDLTPIGSPVATSFRGGNGVRFPTINDAYSITDDVLFKPTIAYSIGCWFNTTVNDNGGVLFQSWNDNMTALFGVAFVLGTAGGIQLFNAFGTGYALNTDWASAAESPSSTVDLVDGKDHFVVGTWDGANLKVYTDGKLVATAPCTKAPVFNATNYIRVGCGTDNTGNNDTFLAGKLGDMFWLNGRAITQDEISTLYSGAAWPKTNLTNVDWHTMAITNGVLEICNGNKIALVGYDMSYTNEALDLIPDNASKHILERGKYGIIGCTNTTGKDQTSLFAWDGISLHWNDKGIIKEGSINSMIDTELAIAQIGDKGKLYISDFNNPIPFRQIRGGGKSDIDGVTSYKGMALIGIYGNTNSINGHLANGVYSLGRLNKNAPIVLNLEYQLDCDEIYSVKVVGTDILIAYKSGTQYGVKIVDTDNKSDGIYQTLDLVAPLGTRRYPIPLGRLLYWAKVDLQCQPLPPGCAIECWYKIDKSTTGGAGNDGWIQANIDTGNTGGGTQFKDKGMQNAVFYIGEKARVLEVMLKLLHSGSRTPEVNEVNIYFSAG